MTPPTSGRPRATRATPSTPTPRGRGAARGASGGTAHQERITAALDGVRRVVRCLRESAADAERRLGISLAQLYVLQQLAEAPVDSLNELAARTFTHQSSVSVVVERLVKRGLARRERSTVDARRVTIAITSAGRALLRRAPETASQRLAERLGHMSDRELAGLARTLDDLVEAMRTRSDGAPMFFEGSGVRRPGRRVRTRGTER